jgi:aminopeptidase-like protein
MRVRDLCRQLDLANSGAAMYRLIAEAYPICRSITGAGFRKTLQLLQDRIPLSVHEVPSGTRVLDWTVPKEWNIRDAYIADATGRRVVDFRASNLHVMSYSRPVRGTFSLAELGPHLFTLPEQPDLVPYRTSYYQENWGFCLSERQRQALVEGQYEVCIDASLAEGYLTYGELVLPGEQEDEVLLSCHCCHPSLCNDNLSGMALACRLAELLSPLQRRYTYRFLFIPGTIGAITWLALHEGEIGRIRHGLVLTGVGDPGPITYKRSRRGDAEIDAAAAHALQSSPGSSIRSFSPYGYDERQYCSPGIDLGVGCLMRTPFAEYPQYHTSADNLDFVRPEALADSLAVCAEILHILEDDRILLNLCSKGEPQLGRRGLYGHVGGHSDVESRQMAMLWVLSLSDGTASLLDVAVRSGLPFGTVVEAAEALERAGLLAEAAGSSHRLPGRR